MSQPDPDVLRLAAIDRELTSLVAQMEAARTQYVQATQLWYVKRAERDRLAAYLAAKVTETMTVGVPSGPVGTPPVGALPVGALPAADKTDVSHRTVQNLLFAVGGLLVVVAAVAFRVFAWANVGVAGRAVILAALTLGMLGLPFVALRRGLRATAETFAVVGFVLLLIDGVGAHGMDLFGLGRFGLERYCGWLFAVIAVVAAGYGVATGLRGPRILALIAYLPVFALVLGTPGGPGQASLVLSATVAGLLAVTFVGERDRLIATMSAVLAAVLLFFATVAALDLRPIGAGVVPVALAVAAVVTLAAAYRMHLLAPAQNWLRILGGVLAAIEIAVAAAAALHQYAAAPLLVAYPAVAVALAATVLAVPERIWPRLGTRIGAFIFAGANAAATLVVLLAGLFVYAVNVGPLWHRSLATFADDSQTFTWTLPVGLGAAAVALAVLVARRFAVIPLAAGLAAVVLSLPTALPLLWWVPPIIDGVVLAALLAVIAFVGNRTIRICAAAVSGVIGLHALLTGLIRPATTAAVLAGFVVVGLLHAVIGVRRGPLGQILGGVGLAIAFLSLPGAVAGFATLSQPATTVLRLAAAAVVISLAATIAVGRWWTDLRWYASSSVTFTAVIVGVLAPYVGTHDPVVLYATGAMLATALAPACVRITGWPSMLTASAGALLIPAAVLRVGPAASTVLFLPYTWVAHIWSGAPSGAGLAAAHPWRVDYVDTVAVALVTLAIAALGPLRRAVPVPALVTVLVAVAAAGVGWPGVPLMSLVLGGAATLIAALERPPAWSRTFGERANLALAGVLGSAAGVAGLLPTKATTLGALAFGLVVFAVVGAAGRSVGVQSYGWIRAVTALATLSFAAVRATGVQTTLAAFGVLGAAAIGLAGSAWLWKQQRRQESIALAAAAHAAAVVAMVLAGGATRAAIACAVWGVVVGARALWPGLPAAPRLAHVAAAIGLEVVAWWILLGISARPIDVYTLPAAGALLVIGWLAHRNRPELRSWVAYGPALLAGFLPSSVPLFGPDASVARRLAVGGAALVVLIVGAVTRTQAPTVIGGAAVAVVALHELVLLWQRIPSWIPLSVAGLLVLALAITYERRRRDMGRLRSYVGRMS